MNHRISFYYTAWRLLFFTICLDWSLAICLTWSFAIYLTWSLAIYLRCFTSILYLSNIYLVIVSFSVNLKCRLFNSIESLLYLNIWYSCSLIKAFYRFLKSTKEINFCLEFLKFFWCSVKFLSLPYWLFN